MSGGVHIGELRARLVLEAPARAADDGGGSVVTWEQVALLWAKVSARGGTESFTHDRVAGSASHEIIMRYRSDVTPEMRLREGTRIFDVRAAMDLDGRRQWLRCLAEERDL